ATDRERRVWLSAAANGDESVCARSHWESCKGWPQEIDAEKDSGGTERERQRVAAWSRCEARMRRAKAAGVGSPPRLKKVGPRTVKGWLFPSSTRRSERSASATNSIIDSTTGRSGSSCSSSRRVRSPSIP